MKPSKRKTEVQLCMEKHLNELRGGRSGPDSLFAWVAEWQFHETRKWKIDYVVAIRKNGPCLAIEIEGLHGRHQSIGGFLKDMEKYDEAAIAGYYLIRVTTRQVLNGKAKELIRRWLEARKP